MVVVVDKTLNIKIKEPETIHIDQLVEVLQSSTGHIGGKFKTVRDVEGINSKDGKFFLKKASYQNRTIFIAEWYMIIWIANSQTLLDTMLYTFSEKTGDKTKTRYKPTIETYPQSFFINDMEYIEMPRANVFRAQARLEARWY